MGTGYGTIATLQRWLGPAASVSMAAPGDTDACSGPAETSALVNMQMCGGALAQIAVTVAAAPDQRTAERRVVGTKGSLLARDDPEDELPLVGFEGKVYFPIHVHNPPHVLQYATKQMICHLVECIARDKEPSVTIDETHAALQTLCAAYESHQRGLRVALA